MAILNILLLGETGVGKSTWINSFCNYLAFRSLTDATISENLFTPIPTQFSFTDDNFEEITVSLGQTSENENNSTPGVSVTQGALIHTYKNNIDDTTINFIDTPGMGDTRGITKDAENMVSIMSVIRPLGELHGICILLKPNEARLTLSFRFCIQELLGHLHKETVQNIIFCFTNTRSNFYRPGESIKTLRTLVEHNLPKRSRDEIELNNKTIFCFDSEAFRYIAAVKCGIEFGEDEASNYAQSWDMSSKEAHRMFAHIQSLTPHNVCKTVDLFKVRKTLQAITKPVVDICIEIEVKLEEIQKTKANIEKQKVETTALTKDLLKTKSRVSKTKLNHYRVVCSEVSCTDVVSNQEGKLETHYKSVCHDQCTCVDPGTFVLGVQNEASLLKCAVMGADGACSVCHHPWQVHIFVDFETSKDAVNQVDFNVGGKMLLGLGSMLWKEVGIVDVEKEMKALKEEKEKIQHVAAHLSSVLMANAIDDENDAMAEYMDHLIKLEKEKGQNSKNLADLLEMKKGHELLHKEFKNDGFEVADLSSDEVDELVEELTQLKNSGEKIRNCLKDANLVRGGQIREGVKDGKEMCLIT